MKINTEIPFFTFDGTPMKQTADDKTQLTMGKMLSTVLVTGQQKSFDPLKSYVLAQKFYSEKEVEIDEADYSKLKQVITENNFYTPLALGQALKYLQEDEKS